MSGFVLSAHSNIADFARRIEHHERWRIPYVTAAALTRTAYDAKDEEARVMQRVFDRPTRFTLNSLFVRGANKSNLTAVVEFKEGFGSIPAWRYLGPQVMGGTRKHKSHERRLIAAGLMLPGEYVVPGLGVTLDAHGNVPGSTLNVILSSLGARADAQQNTPTGGRGRRRRARRGHYLVLREGAVARPGVYLRKGPKEIVPVLMFVRPPRYTPRFPFYETARRVMQQNFARHFRQEWARSLSRTPSARAA